MTDLLLDDVKALLEKGFGDDRILKQIYRACENDEIISNYERNYVKKLAEEHLGRRPEILQTKAPVDEKPLVSDVIIPQVPIIQKPQIIQSVPRRISYSKLKNSKMLIGIALIVIVSIAISFSDIFDIDPTGVITPADTIPNELSIQTDLQSYATKDIISISGLSNTTGVVILSIENKNNELVWKEQVSLKNNGRYSTLTIAAGPGWEDSGIYTINIDNGIEIKSDTFSFIA